MLCSFTAQFFLSVFTVGFFIILADYKPEAFAFNAAQAMV